MFGKKAERVCFLRPKVTVGVKCMLGWSMMRRATRVAMTDAGESEELSATVHIESSGSKKEDYLVFNLSSMSPEYDCCAVMPHQHVAWVCGLLRHRRRPDHTMSSHTCCRRSPTNGVLQITRMLLQASLW